MWLHSKFKQENKRKDVTKTVRNGFNYLLLLRIDSMIDNNVFHVSSIVVMQFSYVLTIHELSLTIMYIFLSWERHKTWYISNTAKLNLIFSVFIKSLYDLNHPFYEPQFQYRIEKMFDRETINIIILSRMISWRRRKVYIIYFVANICIEYLRYLLQYAIIHCLKSIFYLRYIKPVSA